MLSLPPAATSEEALRSFDLSGAIAAIGVDVSTAAPTLVASNDGDAKKRGAGEEVAVAEVDWGDKGDKGDVSSGNAEAVVETEFGVAAVTELARDLGT